MLKLSCHCGQIQMTIAAQPDYIHACNCTLCTRTGARWSYFDPSAVGIEGTATGYCRADKADPAALIQFCATCGSTTHFTLTENTMARFGNTMVGVNMQLADEADLAGVELRYPDGRAWPGTGDFGYVRAPRVLGRNDA